MKSAHSKTYNLAKISHAADKKKFFADLCYYYWYKFDYSNQNWGKYGNLISLNIDLWLLIKVSSIKAQSKRL